MIELQGLHFPPTGPFYLSQALSVSWMFFIFLLSKKIDSNPCLNCSLSGHSLSSRLFSGFSVVRFGIAYGTKRNGLTHKIQQNFEKNSTKFRDINEHVCICLTADHQQSIVGILINKYLLRLCRILGDK